MNLALIKEAKGESIHNAKFFALTSEGIFYLLTKWQPDSLQWLIKYKNNLILRVLLYPYFEENTIKPLVMLLKSVDTSENVAISFNWQLISYKMTQQGSFSERKGNETASSRPRVAGQGPCVQTNN